VVRQAHKHKISACDLQKHFKCLDGIQHFQHTRRKGFVTVGSLSSPDEKIRAVFLIQNMTALIQPIEHGNIQASIAYCYGGLLGEVVTSELQIMEFRH
jgi:hypothetical protein